jgi:sugar phosphate isomerase/epimerase
MQYLARWKERYWSFHLKDVVPDKSSDTDLGKGTFDFKKFLAAVPDLSQKPCYVEQEGPADELAAARNNYSFLHGLEF